MSKEMECSNYKITQWKKLTLVPSYSKKLFKKNLNF